MTLPHTMRHADHGSGGGPEAIRIVDGSVPSPAAGQVLIKVAYAGVNRPDVAQRHSGYLVGGTSPFGLRKPMPVWVEATVLGLPRILINGGRRGYLVGLDPAVLVSVLQARPVSCAL